MDIDLFVGGITAELWVSGLKILTIYYIRDVLITIK